MSSIGSRQFTKTVVGVEKVTVISKRTGGRSVTSELTGAGN